MSWVLSRKLQTLLAVLFFVRRQFGGIGPNCNQDSIWRRQAVVELLHCAGKVLSVYGARPSRTSQGQLVSSSRYQPPRPDRPLTATRPKLWSEHAYKADGDPVNHKLCCSKSWAVQTFPARNREFRISNWTLIRPGLRFSEPSTARAGWRGPAPFL